MIVLLGNPQPVHAPGRDENDQPLREALPAHAYEGDETHTVVGPFPEGTSVAEALATVTDPGRGAWIHHSDGPPSWVASDSKLLADVIADHYGCEKRSLPRDQARALRAAEASQPAAGADDDPEPEA